MPKSVQRCTTNLSTSTKEAGSSRRSMRSRALSFPAACWRSMRSAPPPCRAWVFSSSSCSSFVSMDMGRRSGSSQVGELAHDLLEPLAVLRQVDGSAGHAALHGCLRHGGGHVEQHPGGEGLGN